MTDENLDLSHINLFIATPCMSGDCRVEYKDSLLATVKLLELCKAQVHVIDAKYIADIALARAKLLGAFYRHESNPTHLMFIDADMGWNPDDVVRLILQDRDFIGAAGTKKTYPLKFCFQLHDDYARPIPLVHEIETKVGEVTALGGAFVVLKRSCVERLIQSYPELEFDGDANTKECALFDPIIVNMGPEWPIRRLSEDYAFSYRWRKLGGTIHVLLDVRLTHTGAHTFSGSLYEHLVQENSDFANPPAERILKDGETFA